MYVPFNFSAIVRLLVKSFKSNSMENKFKLAIVVTNWQPVFQARGKFE